MVITGILRFSVNNHPCHYPLNKPKVKPFKERLEKPKKHRNLLLVTKLNLLGSYFQPLKSIIKFKNAINSAIPSTPLSFAIRLKIF